MDSRPIAIIALLGIVPAVAVQADHGCNGTITELGADTEAWYVDDRSLHLGERDHWIYRETNGIPGLQSGGVIDPLEESIEPEIWDPCRHRNPDTLVMALF